MWKLYIRCKHCQIGDFIQVVLTRILCFRFKIAGGPVFLSAVFFTLSLFKHHDYDPI